MNEIKPSVYQGPMPGIHWVNVDPEHMVSFQTPFVPNIMEESLKKITLPDHKPVFSGLGESPDGLVVFLNPVTEGTPGILYDISEKETDRMIFQYDDCKFYHGKYYRITGGDEAPFTLTRYGTH